MDQPLVWNELEGNPTILVNKTLGIELLTVGSRTPILVRPVLVKFSFLERWSLNRVITRWRRSRFWLAQGALEQMRLKATTSGNSVPVSALGNN